MKSLRQTLMASHICGVAIAVLVFYSFDYFVRAFLDVFPSFLYFIATAMAIRGMPYVSSRTSFLEQFGLVQALYYLFWAVASCVFAWLVSRWMYGVGPFSCLKRYGPILARRNHA